MVFFSFIVFAFKLAAHSLTFFLGFYGRGNNTIGLGFVYTALSLGGGKFVLHLVGLGSVSLPRFPHPYTRPPMVFLLSIRNRDTIICGITHSISFCFDIFRSI